MYAPYKFTMCAFSQNVKYWYQIRDVLDQFFTHCEELAPFFHGVKFAEFEICVRQIYIYMELASNEILHSSHALVVVVGVVIVVVVAVVLLFSIVVAVVVVVVVVVVVLLGLLMLLSSSSSLLLIHF